MLIWREDIFLLLMIFTIDKVQGRYEIKLSTPNSYKYRYLTEYGIPITNSTSLTFQVQACNDAHVALRSSGRRPLEIVLGGWDNSRSCFRTRVQGSCRTEHRGAILDCQNFQTFWVSWGNQQINVGKQDAGIGDSILSFSLRRPLSDVEIGISTGFGASGLWIFKDPRSTTESPTTTTTTKRPLSSTNVQLAPVVQEVSEGGSSNVSVAVTTGILSVIAVVLVGVFIWRKYRRPRGQGSNIGLQNPMFNAKEMNTYEIIRRSHPEVNMYADLNPLDVTKIQDSAVYYDTAKPFDENNMYLPIQEYSNGDNSRDTRNSRISRMFSHTDYDVIPAMEYQSAKVGQQRYVVDDTYLVPRPSMKKH
ncbi:uncharacterized protein LOC133186411 [Saccostrea echinata]|uniref:uncharacterized protein LOC133186411 n=1 Tax=Saccostrea echinata TaxID=191078 RepID=UPI002A820B1D|nr:uncharacterized protein LOC133186411 [Saccostrea echinata]